LITFCQVCGIKNLINFCQVCGIKIFITFCQVCGIKNLITFCKVRGIISQNTLKNPTLKTTPQQAHQLMTIHHIPTQSHVIIATVWNCSAIFRQHKHKAMYRLNPSHTKGKLTRHIQREIRQFSKKLVTLYSDSLRHQHHPPPQKKVGSAEQC
jgi:hypothetical protein